MEMAKLRAVIKVVHISSCKVRPRAQMCEFSAAVEMRHWQRRIASESGRKKEFMPCVSVRGRGVPATSYTVEMSCTYMAGCVAVGQGMSFDRMWHRRQ